MRLLFNSSLSSIKEEGTTEKSTKSTTESTTLYMSLATTNEYFGKKKKELVCAKWHHGNISVQK